MAIDLGSDQAGDAGPWRCHVGSSVHLPSRRLGNGCDLRLGFQSAATGDDGFNGLTTRRTAATATALRNDIRYQELSSHYGQDPICS